MSEEVPGRETGVLDKQRVRTFLLGGAAGILAGILLAPRSGKELRGSVMERAGEARERSRETLFEARERMQERLSEAREGPHRDPPEPSGREPEDDTPLQPPPRDLSRGFEDEPAGRDAARSEELRRKVRETRARLRGRFDGPREVGEDRDPRPDR
ncbi:MAG: YtxH domain-containing protein [Actinomycetota bacterium]|nr:YtxH domain-containing protein [Actinomycetota bacterium]